MKRYTLWIIVFSIVFFGCTSPDNTDDEPVSVVEDDKNITKVFSIPAFIETCADPILTDKRKFYTKDNHYFLTF